MHMLEEDYKGDDFERAVHIAAGGGRSGKRRFVLLEVGVASTCSIMGAGQ